MRLTSDKHIENCEQELHDAWYEFAKDSNGEIFTCECECPKCGASMNDIEWDTYDIDDGCSTQTATCSKCKTDFCEMSEIVYRYTEITGDN